MLSDPEMKQVKEFLYKQNRKESLSWEEFSDMTFLGMSASIEQILEFRTIQTEGWTEDRRDTVVE